MIIQLKEHFLKLFLSCYCGFSFIKWFLALLPETWTNVSLALGSLPVFLPPRRRVLRTTQPRHTPPNPCPHPNRALAFQMHTLGVLQRGLQQLSFSTQPRAWGPLPSRHRLSVAGATFQIYPLLLCPSSYWETLQLLWIPCRGQTCGGGVYETSPRRGLAGLENMCITKLTDGRNGESKSTNF